MPELLTGTQAAINCTQLNFSGCCLLLYCTSGSRSYCSRGLCFPLLLVPDSLIESEDNFSPELNNRTSVGLIRFVAVRVYLLFIP